MRKTLLAITLLASLALCAQARTFVNGVEQVGVTPGWEVGSHGTLIAGLAELTTALPFTMSSTNLTLTAPTNYNVADIYLTANTSVNSLTTNGAILRNAQKLLLRVMGTGGNYTLKLPTSRRLRRPSSSTMPESFTVTNATTSYVLLDWHAPRTNWNVCSYVWGY